jgi:hypothetical protein
MSAASACISRSPQSWVRPVPEPAYKTLGRDVAPMCTVAVGDAVRPATHGVPSSPEKAPTKQDALIAAATDLAVHGLISAALLAIDDFTAGAAAPLTAGRMGLEVAATFGAIEKLVRLGVTAISSEADAVKISQTFDYLSLTGRATTAGLAIVQSNDRLGSVVGPTSPEKVKLIEAATGLVEAVEGLEQEPGSPRALGESFKAMKELIDALAEYNEKHDLFEAAFGGWSEPYHLLEPKETFNPYGLKLDFDITDIPKSPGHEKETASDQSSEGDDEEDGDDEDDSEDDEGGDGSLP